MSDLTRQTDLANVVLDDVLKMAESGDYTHEVYKDDFVARWDALPALVVAKAMLDRWKELVSAKATWEVYLAKRVRQVEFKVALRQPLHHAWTCGTVSERNWLYQALEAFADEAWFLEDMEAALCAEKRSKRFVADLAHVVTYCGERATAALIRRAKLDRAQLKLPTWHGRVICRLSEVAKRGAWPTVLLAVLHRIKDEWPAGDLPPVVDEAALPWLYRYAESPTLTNCMAEAARAIDSDKARALLAEWPKDNRAGPLRPELTEEELAELVALEDAFLAAHVERHARPT